MAGKELVILQLILLHLAINIRGKTVEAAKDKEWTFKSND
jgi:hypothetical protein